MIIEDDLDLEYENDSKEDNNENLRKIESAILEDDITYMIINMKIEMKDYINHDKKPLLENFDIDVWKRFIFKCLE